MGEIYSGLAHVVEHTILVPSCRSDEFTGQGYTCLNHVCLHFSSSSLKKLQDIDKHLMLGAFIDEENVMCAKHQVIHENMNLSQQTLRNQKIVRFVTDNRITRFAMGDVFQISKIQVKDVKEWFERHKHQGDIYKLFFRTSKDIVYPPFISTPDRVVKFAPVNEFVGEDKFLYSNFYDAATTVDLYIQIPVLCEKLQLVIKAVLEYCIQEKILETLRINVTISDKYFDYDERFVLISLPLGNFVGIENIPKVLRQTIKQITSADFERYRKEFLKIVVVAFKREKFNDECVNEIKNLILYDSPIIQMEDLHLISELEFQMLPIEYIISKPFRVVIK